MKEKTGIYKITNPKGKIYIGQSVNIEKRWKVHCGLYGKNNTKLKRSLTKYGSKNHKFEIIEECSKKQLYKRELYWINYYNCIEDGLNITEGGEGGKLSLSTKQKISKVKKGHKCYKDPKRGEKISKALKGRKNNWGKGKEKKGKKQLIFFKNHVSKMHSKPVLKYDLEENLIEEYPSILNASIICRIHRENIGSVLRGKTKTAGGFVWKYKD